MGAGRSLLQAFGRGEEIEEVRAEYVRFLKDLEGVGPSNRTKDEGLDIFSESDVASDDDSGYSDEDDDSDSEEDDCSAATGVARQRVGLLEQLGQLHRQLLVLRQEAEDEKAKISPVEHAVDVYTATGGKAFLAHGDGERNAARQESLRNQLYTARRFVGEGSKIIVCAVCRPVQMSWSSTGEGFEYSSSACGFTSAIDALCKHNRIQWVCWPGYPVPEASREGVRSKLLSDYSCAPVFLDDDLGRGFYQTMCLQVLWPLLHNCDIDPDIVGEMHEAYEAYAVANQHFLDAVSTLYEDGDVVLVYDFHLMLLPALLRRRFPDVVCGFFLRSPFPSSEFWRILPPRDDMIRGALGADLLGFNHYDYVRHFLNACTRLLGLESSPRHIEYDGRLVSLGVRPLGIDSRLFASTADVQTAAIRLLARFGSKKVLVGVDRLDAVMGIPHKLLAFESLLENHPQWRGEVVLCLVVRDPSSAAFSISKSNDVLRQQVNELVGRVSGRFGTASYCPVLYLRHPLPRDELMALYSIADCVLVTSVREGLNTSALEFIAAQTAPTPFMQVANDPTTESGHNVVSQTASLLPQLKKRHNPGVLVYSEFAACAKSLKGALLVNPFDTDETADAIRRALTMGAKKRKSFPCPSKKSPPA